MLKIKTLLVFLALPLVTVNVMAQTSCNDIDCYDSVINKEKNRVESVYEQALKSSPSERKIQIEKSQKAWESFVTENCKAYVGSNKNDSTSSECTLNLLKKREVELREKLCTDPVTNCPSI
ncbi:lysozyme inhibitor LprI family protein [Pantoea endophytica]